MIGFNNAYDPPYPPSEADPWAWVRADKSYLRDPQTGLRGYEYRAPQFCWKPPSLHWEGFRLRPLTLDEAIQCVRWVRPPDAPPLTDDDRLWWTTGSTAFEVNCELAARVREFLQLHPELPARTRLDLVRFFPSFPGDLDRAVRAARAEADLDGPAPTGGRPDDSGKSGVVGAIDNAARVEAAA